ncbi:small kinetochore-associated protein isoform X1 [Strix uralensis]|uniref:small kinetochore-associated protein isoform X1 n=1 Tax=Strix uralensis TaxID=36305 RepID=UPI003DA1F2E0
MAFPSKKQCVSKTADLEFNKDPISNFSSNIPADGVFKATNQGLPKSAKKAEPLSKKTATKGPLSRYRLEAELKTKNQLLETAKQQLHSRLTGAQGTIKELKEENEALVQEIEKLKKFQETCMVILESRNIDPVTGGNILEEEEKTQECQKQTMLLTEKLIEELKQFNQTTAKEKEVLQVRLGLCFRLSQVRSEILKVILLLPGLLNSPNELEGESLQYYSSFVLCALRKQCVTPLLCRGLKAKFMVGQCQFSSRPFQVESHTVELETRQKVKVIEMTDCFQVGLNQFQSTDGNSAGNVLCSEQLLLGERFQACVAGGWKHHWQDANPPVWLLCWNSDLV